MSTATRTPNSNIIYTQANGTMPHTARSRLTATATPIPPLNDGLCLSARSCCKSDAVHLSMVCAFLSTTVNGQAITPVRNGMPKANESMRSTTLPPSSCTSARSNTNVHVASRAPLCSLKEEQNMQVQCCHYLSPAHINDSLIGVTP